MNLVKRDIVSSEDYDEKIKLQCFNHGASYMTSHMLYDQVCGSKSGGQLYS